MASTFGWLAQPGVLPWVVLAFGLCVGSFLNVVIHRLPKMLERGWREECAELAGQPPAQPENPPYNLVVPRSACPKCGHRITALENIPLVSWLWLRGKCANCKAPIAFRYFGVELLTALLFAAIWWFLTSSVPLGVVLKPELGAILPLWIMAALFVSITFIDAEHLVIPLSFTTASSIAGLAAAALVLAAPVGRDQQVDLRGAPLARVGELVLGQRVRAGGEQQERCGEACQGDAVHRSSCPRTVKTGSVQFHAIAPRRRAAMMAMPPSAAMARSTTYCART